MKLQINIRSTDYEVFFAHSHEDFLSLNIDLIVADDRFLSLNLGDQVIFLKARDGNKNLDTTTVLLEFFIKHNLKKESHVLVIGGGAIQEMAQAACSLYMRGVKMSFMPTTLMSMADSCLGGKYSLNFKGLKNILGGFYHPQAIYVCSDFLKTLSTEDVIAGLFEIAKIAFCKNAYQEYLSLFNTWNQTRDSDALLDLVKFSLRLKADYVQKDPLGENIRNHLNFGHTFGHAFEAMSDFKLSHGLAVGLGLWMACDFFRDKNSILIKNFQQHIEGLLKQVDIILPGEKETFLKALHFDKKNKKDALGFIAPLASGGVEEVFLPFSPQIQERLESSFKRMQTSLLQPLQKKAQLF